MIVSAITAADASRARIDQDADTEQRYAESKPAME